MKSTFFKRMNTFPFRLLWMVLAGALATCAAVFTHHLIGEPDVASGVKYGLFLMLLALLAEVVPGFVLLRLFSQLLVWLALLLALLGTVYSVMAQAPGLALLGVLLAVCLLFTSWQLHRSPEAAKEEALK